MLFAPSVFDDLFGPCPPVYDLFVAPVGAEGGRFHLTKRDNTATVVFLNLARGRGVEKSAPSSGTHTFCCSKRVGLPRYDDSTSAAKVPMPLSPSSVAVVVATAVWQDLQAEGDRRNLPSRCFLPLPVFILRMYLRFYGYIFFFRRLEIWALEGLHVRSV